MAKIDLNTNFIYFADKMKWWLNISRISVELRNARCLMRFKFMSCKTN